MILAKAVELPLGDSAVICFKLSSENGLFNFRLILLIIMQNFN